MTCRCCFCCCYLRTVIWTWHMTGISFKSLKNSKTCFWLFRRFPASPTQESCLSIQELCQNLFFQWIVPPSFSAHRWSLYIQECRKFIHSDHILTLTNSYALESGLIWMTLNQYFLSRLITLLRHDALGFAKKSPHGFQHQIKMLCLRVA